jgi:PAS domain S-box-containing protein
MEGQDGSPASASDSRGDVENWLRLIVENSPDVILTLDRDARVRFINFTIPPYTPDEVLGTIVFDYVQDSGSYRRAFEEVLATEEPREVELRSDGPTWWLTRMIPVKRDGNVENVLVIATEISERKRAEQALRESENRFRTLAETTTAAIFIFQGSAMIYANPAAELITGYTIPELTRMNFWEVIHPDERDQVKAQGMARQQGQPIPERYEAKLLTKSGEERWVDYAGSVFELHGAPAVVGTAVDITERKRAEAERLRLEAQVQYTQKLESLGALAGGLAHDFNNLLTGILGSASLASMKVPVDSPAAEQLERILVSAEKAAELTSKMLAYAGKGQFVMAPSDLNQLIEEVLPLVRSSLGKMVAVKLVLAPNLPEIEADRAQLQQVIVNLLTNAAEALDGAEGEIVVRTGAMTSAAPGAGATVFLEVRDDGPGLDEETQKRIFDPFFTTKFPGRGLGLSAVQGIVRAHRGSIRVESQPRRGATFTVHFPTSSGRPRIDAEHFESGRSHAGETILVVDDEESVREVARASLEERGFEVLTASDGATALTLFEARSDEVDAVLLDITMPGLSGEDTLDALKRLKADVRVLLTSGHGEQEVARKFGRRGLAGFVQKPFRADELAHRIEELLSRS